MFQTHPKSSYHFDEATKCLSAMGPDYEPYAGGLGRFYFDFMRKWAAKDMIAHIDASSGEQLPYADLLQLAIKTALFMRKEGVQPGDIISTCSVPHARASVPVMAAQMLGAIVASTDPSHTVDETRYMLNMVQPKLCFVSAGQEGKIREALAPRDDCRVITSEEVLQDFTPEEVEAFSPYEVADLDATCMIMFSSGTTGQPKGILLGHNFFMITTSRHDLSAMNLKMFHYGSYYWVGTMHGLHIAIGMGMTSVSARKFIAEDYWRILKTYQISLVRLAPATHLETLKTWQSIDDTTTVLCVAIVGANLHKEDYAAAGKYYARAHVLTVYALTESGTISTFRAGDTFGSVGTLDLNNQTIKIIDLENGKPVGLNARGEILVKRAHQMNGYFNMPSADCWDAEGFLRTGDLGYIDDDFNLYVIERIKESFRYRGFDVIPATIEEVLRSHPAVLHGVAIGMPHRQDGWHAMAVVALKSGGACTAAEIECFANERLNQQHQIRAGVVIVHEADIPLTPSGKISRKKLREIHGHKYNF